MISGSKDSRRCQLEKLNHFTDKQLACRRASTLYAPRQPAKDDPASALKPDRICTMESEKLKILFIGKDQPFAGGIAEMLGATGDLVPVETTEEANVKLAGSNFQAALLSLERQ